MPDKTFEKPGVCLNGYHQDITETMVTRRKQEQAIMELLEKVRKANSASDLDAGDEGEPQADGVPRGGSEGGEERAM